jgi:inosine-uridine nucleoside N-ribohydrolase
MKVLPRYVLALFFGLFLSSAVGAATDPILVIEDNDFLGPGGTDIQAALPVIGNPKVKTLGLTVVVGDGYLGEETAAILRFLEIAGRTDIPVVKGAAAPLVNSLDRARAWQAAYGKIAWLGAWSDPKPDEPSHPDEPLLVPPHPAGEPKIKAMPGVAAQFLIEQVHRYPHQVTIIALGPMTNLALAIRLDPDFAALAKQLVFMGGLIDSNLPQLWENPEFNCDFNILFDPEAAHITLTAPWAKIVNVGNVTHTTLMSQEVIDRIVAKKTPLTAFVAKYAQVLPFWDEMAAAIAVDPSLVTKEVVGYMDVDLDHGQSYGMLHVWPDSLRPHRGERAVIIVQAVDVQRFLDEFVAYAQFSASK